MESKVSYRFSNFGSSLLFSVKEKRFSNYTKMIINGVRNLDKRTVKAFAKKITDSFVVENFLEYEYMRYVNDEGIVYDYKSRIVIDVTFNNHELVEQLMRQFLTNERSEIGIGRIFMLQSISDGFISTSEHLSQLIKDQVPPDNSFPRHHSLYAYPLYKSLVRNSFDSSFIDGGLKDFTIPRCFRSSKNMNLLFVSFLSNSNGLTFSEFLENPVVGDFKADDPLGNFVEVYEWVLKNQSKIDMKKFANMTASEMTLVKMSSMFSGLDLTYLTNSDLVRRFHQISHDAFNSYLVGSDRLDEVYSILTEASYVGTIDGGRNELKSYLCYLMWRHSIEDAKELLSVFPAICESIEQPKENYDVAYDVFNYLIRENSSNKNRVVKLLSERMQEVLVYFDGEKTMSLEMWATLHDFIGMDD